MSIIHINHIKSHVTDLFGNLIDLSDAGKNPEEELFLTRALAAYSVQILAQASPEKAAQAVTDGGEDNGIDAIHYDKSERRLYLVQSKWIKNGKGEPDNGSVKKFISGITDLFNLKFDRFNQKVRDKESQILKALDDPYCKYTIVLSYTGVDGLAEHSARDLSSLMDDLNDANDIVDLRILKQQNIHKALTASVDGDPIDLKIQLRSWGKVENPHPAFYGQVCATQIAEWWATFHTRLFAKNLRSLLGNTDINMEIRHTLSEDPDLFWYYNNGITMVAKNVSKSMAHGSNTDVGDFTCEEVSIVNGAQTVGSIGRYSEAPLTTLEGVNVPIRIISLSSGDESFGKSVTRTNNRQNRIDNRDFVALDPEQARIKTELALDGVSYHVMRSADYEISDKSFDLTDSTSALACASGDGALAVLLKREIGKLWEDLDKPPYKQLFNPSVTGTYVWNCVKIQRLIDRSLIDMMGEADYDSRFTAILVHGNRVLAALIFSMIAKKPLKDPQLDFDKFVDNTDIPGLVIGYANRLVSAVDEHFPNSIIPTLFKNRSKCESLLLACKIDQSTEVSQMEFVLF